MKRFSLFLLLTLTVTVFSHAYDFQVGCFYYNITNDTLPPFTVELARFVNAKEVADAVTYGYANYTLSNDINNTTIEVTSHKTYDEAKKYVNLKEIIIPENITYNNTTYQVTRIGKKAFYYCEHIKTITMSNTVTDIEDYAFAFCKGLKSVTLSDNLKHIGDKAFLYVNNLTSLDIPYGVISIGNKAFASCTKLNDLHIPNSVKCIGYQALEDTPWYKSLPDGVLYINNMLYKYKGIMPENTSIKVREGVETICADAFWHCSTLKSIAFPKTLTHIGQEAFNGCSTLSFLYCYSQRSETY